MKAIALLSGGLDSVLAAKIVQLQGIEVVLLNFQIPFCHKGRRKKYNPVSYTKIAAENLQRELKTIDLSDDYLDILKNPSHGFGSNMNPCIDCKILMLKKAKVLLQDYGASFIVTGEVVGQRPMSQLRDMLRHIEKCAAVEGLVLRPLSAKLMPETIPEKEGWVKREDLLDINGRSRKPQFALAKQFGIKEFGAPAGGCLLTDPEFSERLKDLISHNELTLRNINLLKIGRHFRFKNGVKLIVARDEVECLELEKLASMNEILFMPNDSLGGPTSLGIGNFDSDMLKLCASINCRYSDLNGSLGTKIICKTPDGVTELYVEPAEEELVLGSRI